MKNDFQEDLKYSLNAEHDKLFNDLYSKKFPHLERIEIVNDIQKQKKGIDKILHLKCGKTIFIDEKKRRKDYGDILIEEYSDFENKKVGWIGGEKHTDYIVYLIVPSKVVYFLPFTILQLTWIDNWRSWLELYGRKFAKNKHYTTSSIPIPERVLFKAMYNQMKMILHNTNWNT